MEYRIKDVDLHCEEGLLKVGGYINVTERESEMLYSKKRGKWFKEVMKRGVFKTAISRAKNIPLLLEHSWDKQLATTENSSLSLKEDNIGLRFDAVIDNDSIYEQVKLGVINSCSFGFRALDEEIEPVNDRLEKRFVRAIELLEVSLVKNPAYVGSLVESRAYEEELENTEEPNKESDQEDSNQNVDDKKSETSTDEKENPTDEKENSDEEKEKDSDEENEDSSTDEDRSNFIDETQTVIVADEIKSGLVEIVDGIIEEKELEIELTQIEENGVNEHLENVKFEHQMIEQNLENTSRFLSTEIIKLRLELLRLKTIKDGI